MKIYGWVEFERKFVKLKLDKKGRMVGLITDNINMNLL